MFQVSAEAGLCQDTSGRAGSQTEPGSNRGPKGHLEGHHLAQMRAEVDEAAKDCSSQASSCRDSFGSAATAWLEA